MSEALLCFIPIRELLFEIAEIVEMPDGMITTMHSPVFQDNQASVGLGLRQRLGT